jgi:hypothetical protein
MEGRRKLEKKTPAKVLKMSDKQALMKDMKSSCSAVLLDLPSEFAAPSSRTNKNQTALCKVHQRRHIRRDTTGKSSLPTGHLRFLDGRISFALGLAQIEKTARGVKFDCS